MFPTTRSPSLSPIPSRENHLVLLLVSVSLVLLLLPPSSLAIRPVESDRVELVSNSTESNVSLSKPREGSFAEMIDRALENEFTENEQNEGSRIFFSPISVFHSDSERIGTVLVNFLVFIRLWAMQNLVGFLLRVVFLFGSGANWSCYNFFFFLFLISIYLVHWFWFLIYKNEPLLNGVVLGKWQIRVNFMLLAQPFCYRFCSVLFSFPIFEFLFAFLENPLKFWRNIEIILNFGYTNWRIFRNCFNVWLALLLLHLHACSTWCGELQQQCSRATGWSLLR